MKKSLVLSFLACSLLSFAQSDDRITTIQFVQVLNDQMDEVLFYYRENWRVLRETAMKEGIISSYEFIRVEKSRDYPFDILLITTYKDQDQFEKREENFARIMEGRELKLLNEVEPGDFRKTVYVSEASSHSFD